MLVNRSETVKDPSLIAKHFQETVQCFAVRAVQMSLNCRNAYPTTTAIPRSQLPLKSLIPTSYQVCPPLSNDCQL